MIRFRGLAPFCLLVGLLLSPMAWSAGAAATEQQLKSVFLFNFSHFVQWPAEAFRTPTEPFVIGVLGSDEFATQLEEVIRGELIQGRPMQVQRFSNAADMRPSHILYVDQSGNTQLDQVLELLKGRNTLTVSDVDRAPERGVIIQLVKVDNRIRLRINVEAARAARLTLSSNLLRPAQIVRTGAGD